MPNIVTGSYVDFAGAARGASALVADGFVHGEVSIIARPAGARPVPAVALVAGAVGAMIAPGSVLAWAADMGALLVIAPSFGAIAGACLGAAVAALARRRSRSRTEDVRVVVDAARAPRVEAILLASGATLARRTDGGRLEAPPRPLRFVPYRP